MKKRITASELMAKLNADPEFAAKQAKQEEEQRNRAAELRDAEATLVRELKSAGFEVASVWDLVNRNDEYPEAVPILLKHLLKSYPGAIREGIARALAVPQARGSWNVLLKMYSAEGDKRAKDGLAVAIAAIAEDDEIDQLIALVRDPRHGPSRLLLLSALERAARIDTSKARSALMALGADPDLGEEVRVILRKLKRSRSSRSRTDRF